MQQVICNKIHENPKKKSYGSIKILIQNNKKNYKSIKYSTISLQ